MQGTYTWQPQKSSATVCVHGPGQSVQSMRAIRRAIAIILSLASGDFVCSQSPDPQKILCAENTVQPKRKTTNSPTNRLINHNYLHIFTCNLRLPQKSMDFSPVYSASSQRLSSETLHFIAQNVRQTAASGGHCKCSISVAANSEFIWPKHFVIFGFSEIVAIAFVMFFVYVWIK